MEYSFLAARLSFTFDVHMCVFHLANKLCCCCCTGSHGRGAHRPDLCEQSVTRLGRSTLLLNSKAPEQMTAPRWNRLASSTSCFGSSACPQCSSSVLCKTAYGPESPQDRLGGKAQAIQIN